LSSGESERRSWEGANSALPSVEKDPLTEPDEAPVVEVELPKPPSIRT
jgi:replication fork protection complex subunit Tof1/Swi1